MIYRMHEPNELLEIVLYITELIAAAIFFHEVKQKPSPIEHHAGLPSKHLCSFWLQAALESSAHDPKNPFGGDIGHCWRDRRSPKQNQG